MCTAIVLWCLKVSCCCVCVCVSQLFSHQITYIIDALFTSIHHQYVYTSLVMMYFASETLNVSL